MIVNFASGTHPFPAPWWNVDLNDHPGVDLRVDLLAGLSGLVDIETAYVGHFIEHLLPHEAREFLTRVGRAMRPDGQIVVVSPDVHKAISLHEGGLLSDDLLRAIRAHGLREGNDVSHVHEWNCHESAVRTLLEEAGFTRIANLDWTDFGRLHIPVISDAAWQFALIATPGACSW